MTCANCTQFIDDPARIEASIPGLTAMGSARASVRADDGLCALHDRMASARDQCGQFSPRVRSSPDQP